MVGYFRFAVKAWPIVVALLGIDLIAALIAYLFNTSASGPPLAITGFIALGVNPFINPTMEMYDPSQSPEDPNLSRQVEAMAKTMNLKPPKVKRLTGPKGSSLINAWLKDNTIFITDKAVQRMSDAEVTFLLGHELGHVKRLEERRASFKAFPPVFAWLVIILFIVVMACIKVDFYWPYRAVIFGAVAVSLILAIKFLEKNPINSKEIELECDRIGAELCGDYQSAYSAIEKLTANEKPIDVKLSNYPSREQRLSQITELSARQSAVLT